MLAVYKVRLNLKVVVNLFERVFLCVFYCAKQVPLIPTTKRAKLFTVSIRVALNLVAEIVPVIVVILFIGIDSNSLNTVLVLSPLLNFCNCEAFLRSVLNKIEWFGGRLFANRVLFRA